MRKKIMAMLFLTALLLIPTGSVDADSLIGGEGHGDGIDVIYSSLDQGGNIGRLYIKMEDPPTEDISVLLMSASDEQSVEHMLAAKEFNIVVKALVKEEYTILVTLSNTGTIVTECQMVVGSSATITFNANGGSGTMSPVGCELGTEYVIPDCTFSVPDGKHFIGWSDPRTGTTYEPGDRITIEGSMALKAIWEDDVYTISYSPGKGTGSMSPTTALYGDKLVLPECTFDAPEGESFTGWSIDDVKYSAGDTVTIYDDTEIIAMWNDGSNFPIIYVIVGASLFVLALIAILLYRSKKRGTS